MTCIVHTGKDDVKMSQTGIIAADTRKVGQEGCITLKSNQEVETNNSATQTVISPQNISTASVHEEVKNGSKLMELSPTPLSPIITTEDMKEKFSAAGEERFSMDLLSNQMEVKEEVDKKLKMAIEQVAKVQKYFGSFFQNRNFCFVSAMMVFHNKPKLLVDLVHLL